MAVDYAALKKGGFMRQKQKNKFSFTGSRRKSDGGKSEEDRRGSRKIWGWTCPSDIETECGDSICQA